MYGNFQNYLTALFSGAACFFRVREHLEDLARDTFVTVMVGGIIAPTVHVLGPRN
jgi:hypothetical protein